MPYGATPSMHHQYNAPPASSRVAAASSWWGAAKGRLRGPKGKGQNATPEAAPWAATGHVPQRPPPRFVPGSVPQQQAPDATIPAHPAAAAAVKAPVEQAPPTATATSKSTTTSKRKELLNTLTAKSTAAPREVEEEEEEKMAAGLVQEEPVVGEAAPVQCSLTPEAEAQKAAAPAAAAVGSEDTAVTALAPGTSPAEAEATPQPQVAAAPVAAHHTKEAAVPLFSPLTPPSPEAAAFHEPADVSMNPDLEESDATVPTGGPEDEQPDVVVPTGHHHPLQYIPPFAFESIYCSATAAAAGGK